MGPTTPPATGSGGVPLAAVPTGTPAPTPPSDVDGAPEPSRPSPNTLHVAYVDWLSVDETNPPQIWDGQYTQGVSASVLLAAQHFNERRADLVPQLRALACGVNISVVQTCDTAGNARKTAHDMAYVFQTFPVDAVVGFGGVGDATVGVPQADAWGATPALSEWVSAEQMTDRNQYPNFARTTPSDYAIADKVVALLQQFQYQEVALLYLVDGTDYATYLASELEALGYQAQSVMFDYAVDDDDIASAVAQIASFGLNVVVCATWAAQLSQIADAAQANGLLTDDNFWLLTYLDRNPFVAELEANANLTRLMLGSLSLGVVVDSPSWAAFLAGWPSYERYRAAFNEVLPPHGTGSDTQYCANSALAYQLADDFFTPPVAALGNDVWAYA